jgi:hypothetical protein
MADGWSVKQLVREIVLSATYRQSSRLHLGGASFGGTSYTSPPLHLGSTSSTSPAPPDDPANELLSHMSRRRLSIEQWRDSLLFVTGELDRSGGESLELDDPANHRRTVYARVSRLKLNDLLMQFDYPDANVHAEKRSVTTTPMQKLFMLNSAFAIERSRALADRLSRLAESTRSRVVAAYRLLFAREPTSEEIDLAVDFLRTASDDGLSPWTQYAQMLLASNEMLYVD